MKGQTLFIRYTEENTLLLTRMPTYLNYILWTLRKISSNLP